MARESHAALLQKLDDDYAAYLAELDSYMNLREGMARSFANGFFSLAQANFTAPNRTRYGRDYYDQRTQASRTVSISPRQAATGYEFQLIEANNTKKDEIEKEVTGSDDSSHSRDTSEKQQQKETVEEEGAHIEAPKVTTRDPIKWFGILVPQALRTSQGHFRDAVEKDLLQLASIDSRMKELEIAIRRTRKHIGKFN